MSRAHLVLASTSEARRRLLERLGMPFEVQPPQVDEHALHGRTPDETALLRAFAKAEDVRARVGKDAWVIGSDQLVDLDGDVLGKPGSPERARQQLARLAGKTHRLVTALVVLGPSVRESRMVVTRLTMRPLTESEIADYVAADQPEACAGSYKIESLGRALFTAISAGDETAIEGLPLGVLSSMLRPLRDGSGGSRGRRPPEAAPAP